MAVIKAKDQVIPLQKPKRALQFKQFFEAAENQTHSNWIKLLVIELFDIFGNEHLKLVSGYQVRKIIKNILST